jgi:hypothetical protein
MIMGDDYAIKIWISVFDAVGGFSRPAGLGSRSADIGFCIAVCAAALRA